jgi:ABC-type proline/glycine betaine transport system permease subunit
MHLNFIAIGIIAGLILTLLVGIFYYRAYDNKHWITKITKIISKFHT